GALDRLPLQRLPRLRWYHSPVVVRLGGQSAPPGVVIDHELPDVLRRPPDDLPLTEHRISGGPSRAIAVYGDTQFWTWLDWPRLPRQAADAAALRLRQIDLITDAFRRVEIVSDDPRIGQRALGAGFALAGEEISRRILQRVLHHLSVPFDRVQIVLV